MPSVLPAKRSFGTMLQKRVLRYMAHTSKMQQQVCGNKGKKRGEETSIYVARLCDPVYIPPPYTFRYSPNWESNPHHSRANFPITSYMW
jgi:hypothetical protein